MPIKVVKTHFDHTGYSLQNVAIHPRSSDPSIEKVGQVYFNVNENLLKLYHENKWNSLANQTYVDYRPQVKEPIKVVSVSNIPLTNVSILDGVSLSNGDRVLLVGQTDAKTNGVYTLNSGNLTRTTDTNSGDKLLPGTLLIVKDGLEYANTIWSVTNSTEVELGIDDLLLTQVGGTTSVVAVNKGGTNNTTFTDQKLLIYEEATDSIISSNFSINALTKTIAFDITGAALEFSLTHNLSVMDVIIQVYDKADGATVEATTLRTNYNEIMVKFNTAPGLNTYRVVIQGNGVILDPGLGEINGGDADNIF